MNVDEIITRAIEEVKDLQERYGNGDAPLRLESCFEARDLLWGMTDDTALLALLQGNSVLYDAFMHKWNEVMR